MRIDGRIRIAAVFGDTVAHAVSPATRGTAFAALGMNRAYAASRAPTPHGRAARRAGTPTANALEMLPHQGALALRLGTGEDSPLSAMREAPERVVYG